MQTNPSRYQPRQTISLTSTSNEIVLLTDNERDEIDFEAKTIIRQTMDRIQKMEDLEKGNMRIYWLM